MSPTCLYELQLWLGSGQMAILPPRLLEKADQENVLKDRWFNGNVTDVQAGMACYMERRANTSATEKLVQEKTDQLFGSKSKPSATAASAEASKPKQRANLKFKTTQGKLRDKGKTKATDEPDTSASTSVSTSSSDQPKAVQLSSNDFVDIGPYTQWLNRGTLDLESAVTDFADDVEHLTRLFNQWINTGAKASKAKATEDGKEEKKLLKRSWNKLYVADDLFSQVAKFAVRTHYDIPAYSSNGSKPLVMRLGLPMVFESAYVSATVKDML